MKGLKSFFEDKFFNVATKIANQRHLLAMRDGLVLAMPLLIIGSLFIIISDFPLQAYQDFMLSIFGEGWGDFVWNDVVPATTGLLSLVACFGIAKSLVDSYQLDGMPGGMIALAAFFLINNLDVEANAWNADLFGTSNLFVAMIISLLAGELYRVIVQRKLVIKLPDSVPPSVSRSFTALVPAAIILVLALVVKMLFRLTPFGDFPSFVTAFVTAPLTFAGTSYPGSALAVLVEQILWSLGIHGSSIVTSVMEPIWLNANLENLAAFQAGQALPHIITQTFVENLLWIGGSGATLPVVIYMVIFARSKTLKQVGRLSLVPGLFNINEPVVFGLPIVMNPFLIIPYILSPLVILTISYFGMFFNIFPRMVGVTIPWTTPYLISGYLATGANIGGVILQIINFVVAFLIWLPFIRSWDRRNVLMESQAN